MKVYTLPLSEIGKPIPSGNGQFINLPPPDAENPYILRFVIFSASEIVNKAILHCNVPPKGVEFDRFKFYEYPIKADFGKETYIDVEISVSGAFCYFITYLPISENYFSENHKSIDGLTLSSEHDISEASSIIREATKPPKSKFISALRGNESPDAESLKDERNPDGTVDALSNDYALSCTPKYYFTVSSGFMSNGKPLSLNSLKIESVISKWMGPVDTWNDKLKKIQQKGYNMVHFTPIQQRGESNSPYSIYDQLAFDKDHFPKGEKDVENLVNYMERDLQLLSLTDVVYNHTANNSDWLKDHPEAGYSVETAPHLNPALDLDNALLEFSSKLKSMGFPTMLNSIDDLDRIINGVKLHVLEPLKLWEYYVINVEAITKETTDILTKKLDTISAIPVPHSFRNDIKALAIFAVENASVDFDKFGHGRNIRTFDAHKLASIIYDLLSSDDGDMDVSEHKIHERVVSILNEVNLPLYRDYDRDISEIINQLYNRIKYTRLDDHGPKFGEINEENPLIETYFTRITSRQTNKIVALANNGWIWNGNPLIDFASSRSRAYLRREVIVWGDCVKLRYGSHPRDSPYLWDRMTKYTQQVAKYFHGFRIDNCHSTPLHVGEYMLDKARLVRSNLYVVAELFTGSEEMDRIFVERLGITSLIREAMQAWSVEELSRLVHKHGGRPIGSFSKQPLVTFEQPFAKEDQQLVYSTNIHALFMDCTHDNETPAQKRTVEDTLPSAALVAICSCAVGSVMGYDEGYPKLLDIVNETREYTFDGGIGAVKKVLYDVHTELGQQHADEMHVHHEGQYITVHRVNSNTGEGWFLIARTYFGNEGDQKLSDIRLEGTKAEVVLSTSIEKTGDYKNDETVLKSIPTKIVDLEHPTIYKDGNDTVIRLDGHFPQGSIALIKTTVQNIEGDLGDFIRSGADEAVADLNPLELNAALYKCDGEEHDSSQGENGVYHIPNYGSLVYAGIAGWIGPLSRIINENDLGHPISNHLREGKWALDHTVNRLSKFSDQDFPNLKPYIKWLKTRFDAIRNLPSFLIPRFFALIVLNAYLALKKRGLSLFPDNIKYGTVFLHRLALTSYQLVGKVHSSSLFPFDNVGSLSAGLPHFSFDYMRCWGRDVFIALRGQLLSTGRYHEAKAHILGFAATLKHGLIPNLLDSGRNPRYNARDATWFFTQVLQDYVKYVPNGVEILDEKVKRRFPLNDDWVPVDDPRAFSTTSTIREILYEILSRHAAGITFREANAGINLDSQMTDEGFNQHIYVDWENGFIFGGNKHNCGTWMDKMGESEKAGNKGIPGTPRDGAAIEIIGLLKSTLRFVTELNQRGKFDYTKVINQNGKAVTFKQWNDTLQDNFEKCFYIPVDVVDDKHYNVRSEIIHRRGIYKDLYRSSNEYEDYQLRPNFAIAMTAAPELFDVNHAIKAIKVADQVIRGPVGMRTLDPADFNYRPDYYNGLDNDDFATSKGRNYHQGPEWVWCMGYFLRAFLYFDILHKQNQSKCSEIDKMITLQQIYRRLEGNRHWIRKSDWFGLPELTNRDGAFCGDSCATQAWSSSTLIDIFQDVADLE